jgi:hypothetical protein
MDRQALRRLHDIKYRELPTLINKTITIAALDSIAVDVENKVRPYLPACGKLELRSSNMQGILAKYKMLDLSFTTETPVLTQEDKIDRQTLVDLGFLTQKPQDASLVPTNGDEAEEDPTCLNDLIEEGQKGYESLMIFLDLWPIRNAIAEYMQAVKQAQSTGDPVATALDELLLRVNDLFPGTFKIRDVCITNSDFVWFHKHFYM